MRIKQLCNREVRNFAMALRARKVSGAFEKRAPGQRPDCICNSSQKDLEIKGSVQFRKDKVHENYAHFPLIRQQIP